MAAWSSLVGGLDFGGCFFFFQAEDGIRDLLVTGVQTCALPILPVSPGASRMQPRDPCRPWRGTLASGHKPRGGLLALQSLEGNPQLSFATRMEDWSCLGQHKTPPEFPVVTRESRPNSRKTTWLPRHRKMKPFPATAPQEKSHVRNWRSKGHLAPWMRPTKFPEIPVSLERNTEVFRHPLL